jgi:hypothetical protein
VNFKASVLKFNREAPDNARGFFIDIILNLHQDFLQTALFHTTTTNVMKKMTTLQFPSIESLWAFKSEIRPSFFEVKLFDKRLSIEASREDLDKAVIKYKAKIITMTHTLN